MEKNKQGKGSRVCDPCEMDFQKNIKGLVNNVKHSKADHAKKGAEVHAAFDRKRK